MSIERTLISRSQPYIVSNLAKSTIEIEARKGCESELSNFPVRLEPTYLDASNWSINQSIYKTQSKGKEHAPTTSLKQYLCWIPPEYGLEWIIAERFIKILKGARNKVVLK